MAFLQTNISWIALGGFTGLVTFVFAVWDRLFRNRPLAWVSVRMMGRRACTYLQVRNQAPVDILVRNLKSNCEQFQLAGNETVREIARAAMGDAILAIVQPGETRSFPIFLKNYDPDGHDNTPVRFTISWRKVSGTRLPQIPKWVFTTSGSIRQIVAASKRQMEPNH